MFIGYFTRERKRTLMQPSFRINAALPLVRVAPFLIAVRSCRRLWAHMNINAVIYGSIYWLKSCCCSLGVPREHSLAWWRDDAAFPCIGRNNARDPMDNRDWETLSSRSSPSLSAAQGKFVQASSAETSSHRLQDVQGFATSDVRCVRFPCL